MLANAYKPPTILFSLQTFQLGKQVINIETTKDNLFTQTVLMCLMLVNIKLKVLHFYDFVCVVKYKMSVTRDRKSVV